MRLTVAVAIDVWVFGAEACCCCSEVVSGLRRLLKPRCEVVDDM
jgi:hypothetical protein